MTDTIQVPRWLVVTAVLLFPATLLTWAAPQQSANTLEIQDSDKKEYSPRLPNNWTQLGLTKIQVDKIHELQTNAHKKIEPLEKQIETIKEQLEKDLRGVLRGAQTEKLALIESDTKRQRELKSTLGNLSEECDDWIVEINAGNVDVEDIQTLLDSIKKAESEIGKLIDADDRKKFMKTFGKLKAKADTLQKALDKKKSK